jgi:hypothetical protein
MVTRRLLNQQETNEFITELATRMEAVEGDKINIQIGKNSVYQGVVGQDPQMSKLTETRVGVLRSAIDMDAPSIGEKGDPSKLKQAIVLEKNSIEMFRFEKGEVIKSALTSLEPLQQDTSTAVEGVEVVALNTSEDELSVTFESATPFEVFRTEIEASSLPEESNVRASTQQFVQQKEEQAKLQQQENAKNWQWFQIARLEERRGTYSGSVSIEAIQELAVSKAPVPDSLLPERDMAVSRAEQYVISVASKALEVEGTEIVPGVKTVSVGGYQITRNEVTGDLSIDKPRQSFLRQDTGKIERSYRPDGVLKAKGEEVTHNRLLVKDLDNFEYIERKQITREQLSGMRDLVHSYGKQLAVPIEVWKGGNKQEASLEKMDGRVYVSMQMKMQFIESGKHLQVRDLEGNLLAKAYGDKVEKPLSREQALNFGKRYEQLQQLRLEKMQQQQAQASAKEQVEMSA